jgi:hypothetical protein
MILSTILTSFLVFDVPEYCSVPIGPPQGPYWCAPDYKTDWFCIDQSELMYNQAMHNLYQNACVDYRNKIAKYNLEIAIIESDFNSCLIYASGNPNISEICQESYARGLEAAKSNLDVELQMLENFFQLKRQEIIDKFWKEVSECCVPE